MWDPLQMAELHGLYMGVILTTYKSWDDPPSTLPETNSKFAPDNRPSQKEFHRTQPLTFRGYGC